MKDFLKSHPAFHLFFSLTLISSTIGLLVFAYLNKIFGLSFDPITYNRYTNDQVVGLIKLNFVILPALVYLALAFMYYYLLSTIREISKFSKILGISYFIFWAAGCFSYTTQSIYIYIRLILSLAIGMISLLYQPARDDVHLMINISMTIQILVFAFCITFGMYLLYLFVIWKKHKPARRVSKRA